MSPSEPDSLVITDRSWGHRQTGCNNHNLRVKVRPSTETADRIFDQIAEYLTAPEFRPRAVYERFNIEVPPLASRATTWSPIVFAATTRLGRAR